MIKKKVGGNCEQYLDANNYSSGGYFVYKKNQIIYWWEHFNEMEILKI